MTGTEDSIIASSDLFVQKARDAGAPITYFRIDGMDHYVRKRPDVIDRSFEWLKQQLTWLPPPYRVKCVSKNRGALTFYHKHGWIEIERGTGEDGDYLLLELPSGRST